MVPTIQSLAVNPTASITGESRASTGGRGQSGFRRGLIVAQLALSVTLAIAAGLLVRSFWSLNAVDPGFQAAGILKAEYQLPESRYPRDFSRWPRLTEIHAYNAALLVRAAAIPGVTSAALAGAHPLDPGFTSSFRIVGREDEAKDWPEISIRSVSRDYFAALGLRVLQGRAFATTDLTETAPVAVINQAAARRFFASRDPVGQQIGFWGSARTIVGVVTDERFHGLAEAAPIAVYTLLDQAPMNGGVLLVRTDGHPASLAKAVTDAIHAVDPGLAVSGVEPLVDTLRGSVGQQRFAMLVLVTFGGLTLSLAVVGIYSVLAYTTTQRTREIGIRSALGASRGNVANLVMRSGITMAVVGIGLGLVTFVGVPSMVLIAALLASWLPARRAAAIEPIEALRAD
jgi:putative ABC transport system permease protein